MVKKKISGQSILIIILAILLLATIGFGGVFAFYSVKTNEITGKIIMANLNIKLLDADGQEISPESQSGDKSEIVITSGENIIPGQELQNTPLMITNYSTADIYLMVVYKLKAETNDTKKQEVIDKYTYPVIDIGYDYINPMNTEFSTSQADSKDTDWIDYVFYDSVLDVSYRIMFCTVPFSGVDTGSSESITIIPQNKLKLHAIGIDDDYQNTIITFTFQAYAIAANSFSFSVGTSKASKINQIVSAVYGNYDSEFFKANATT